MAWLKSKEDTRQGMEIQFVTILWMKTGLTQTPKGFDEAIIKDQLEETLKRGELTQHGSW